ncbi:hypothetical protein C8Q80DRAFT_1271850 [Daedaleopsis nitida]|nr:hypothetical protein C8Q80DRAFT_1271850 [Daedaleopsis nitida]
MSFPYHQYVDYSNPTTPRVYNWEVASTKSDQDTALQLQQDPQQSVQQPQQISPSQLQLQQLPPPLLPAHQHHSASGSPQEHIHQLQQLQQPQPQLQPQQLQQQHQFTPHHQTIQVAPVQAQPQYRFETVTEEDFIHASATGERPGSSRRRGASKPPLHVDTSRASSSSAAAAASPGPSGAHSAGGPLRVPHSRAHVQSAHPYRRPQSRAASGSGSGASSGAPPPPELGRGPRLL